MLFLFALLFQESGVQARLSLLVAVGVPFLPELRLFPLLPRNVRDSQVHLQSSHGRRRRGGSGQTLDTI